MLYCLLYIVNYIRKVYISEAHATDEWPISNLPIGVSSLQQHKSNADRIQAAHLLKLTYKKEIHDKMEIVCDSIGNSFENVYNSWPFRVWVIEQGKIAYKGMPTQDGDNLPMEDLRAIC